MNEWFAKALALAKENKNTLLKVGGAAVGALVGALVTGVLVRYEETLYVEEDENLVGYEEGDEEEPEEGED